MYSMQGIVERVAEASQIENRPLGHAIVIYDIKTSGGNSGSPIQIFELMNCRKDKETGDDLYDIDMDSLQVIGVHTGTDEDQ